MYNMPNALCVYRHLLFSSMLFSFKKSLCFSCQLAFSSQLTQNSAPNTTTPKSLPQYVVSTRSMISFRFFMWLGDFYGKYAILVFFSRYYSLWLRRFFFSVTQEANNLPALFLLLKNYRNLDKDLRIFIYTT